MAQILYGKPAREAIERDLKDTIAKLPTKPVLAILQVGDRADSNAYINQKKLFAEKIGAVVLHKRYPETVAEEEILHDIENYNADAGVHGIIVQIPLPPHLNKEKLIEAVAPHKDVDGLTAHNMKRLLDGTGGGHVAATARGVVSLLQFYHIPIAGKHVVVVGRSTLVGKPVALALLNQDATVTIAHKETHDLKAVTQTADILVIAIGDPQFITKEYTHEHQVVIDIGINVTSEKKMVGDADFAGLQESVLALSPVPGGVGPMTVASLFQNVVDAVTQ